MSSTAPAATRSSLPHPTASRRRASQADGRIGARARRAGLVVSASAVLFLTLDMAMKLFRVQAAVDGTTQLGFSPSVILPLGLLQLACMALYLAPRTAVLGAVLWTGYLGGAVATHVRLGNPLFSHVLFPVFIGGLLWLGLWLRDSRVRAAIQPSALD